MARASVVPKSKGGKIYSPIPNKIAELRLKSGKSMFDIADAMGMKSGTYGVIESGHTLPSQDMLVKLCVVLNCEMKDIYGEHAIAIMFGYEEVK